ncbi:MAG: hypothetical protein PVI86_17095 [Phycisphaerae bacterium]|jgi:hypothetical protein
MLVTDFLFALIVAFLIFLVFFRGFRRVGPFGGVVWFFLIVLFASWAGGVWIRPVGPTLWGVYWLPFVIVGLVVALLLAASAPPPPMRLPKSVEETEDKIEAESIAVALSAFVWIMLLFLIVAIGVHYITQAAA